MLIKRSHSTGPIAGAPDAQVVRTTVHASPLAEVTNLDVRDTVDVLRGQSPSAQLALPYWGMFSWNIGRGEVYVDSNHALLLAQGLEYCERQLSPLYGHSAMLVTPAGDLWHELWAEARRRDAVPATDVPLRLSTQLRLLTHRWITFLGSGPREILPLDEIVIATCRNAMALDTPPKAVPSRLVRRVKELLQERACEQMSLAEMAEVVGVTPVYLTQAFSRAEGISLYRYQLHLRLARAMLDLPHCDDITTLALGLGFSSHSHFSTAFKAFSGMSPSTFRERFDRQSSRQARRMLEVA